MEKLQRRFEQEAHRVFDLFRAEKELDEKAELGFFPNEIVDIAGLFREIDTDFEHLLPFSLEW